MPTTSVEGYVAVAQPTLCGSTPDTCEMSLDVTVSASSIGVIPGQISDISTSIFVPSALQVNFLDGGTAAPVQMRMGDHVRIDYVTIDGVNVATAVTVVDRITSSIETGGGQ